MGGRTLEVYTRQAVEMTQFAAAGLFDLALTIAAIQSSTSGTILHIHGYDTHGTRRLLRLGGL